MLSEPNRIVVFPYHRPNVLYPNRSLEEIHVLPEYLENMLQLLRAERLGTLDLILSLIQASSLWNSTNQPHQPY